MVNEEHDGELAGAERAAEDADARQEVIDAPVDTSTNSNTGGGHAGQSNFLLTQEPSQGQSVPGRELLRGSDDPTVYLPRTRISEREIARETRIMARHNRRTTSHTNMRQVLAFKYNARMGLNGMGRREYLRSISMATPSFGSGGSYGQGAPVKQRDMSKQEFNK